MKKTENGRIILDRLRRRYRSLPHDLRSRSVQQRSDAQKLLTLTLCIPVMLVCAVYMLHWETNRAAIERDNAAFSALYSPIVAPSPTVMPEAEAETDKTDKTDETDISYQTVSPSPAPTAIAASENFEIALDATRRPLSTPGSDTIVMALETPPPVQKSFADLLALNPDIVGFLRIDGLLSLPVVQKANDNEYYLSHSFNGEESTAGTLFLDGSNLLTPEDANLVIYGHNMKNGTMFRPLIHYEKLDFLKEHPLVRFDTIYQNRVYAPFAVFTITADKGGERHVNIRQFLFDEESFSDFITDMRRLSEHRIPIDVSWGDSVLLLVTCEYTHDNGRFVVALRALREDENPEEMCALIQTAE